ncbi:MAG: hypothetical protein QM715_07760 [Nibricoccus sp.]
MRIPALFVLLAALTLSSSGCFSFTKHKPIAGEVEESFKNRWIAKRMSELQTTGKATDPREARAIALEEFKKKYEYTAVSKKPDPVSSSATSP